MWRSLVAHLHGVQGVEGSNPFTPTISNVKSLQVAILGGFFLWETTYLSCNDVQVIDWQPNRAEQVTSPWLGFAILQSIERRARRPVRVPERCFAAEHQSVRVTMAARPVSLSCVQPPRPFASSFKSPAMRLTSASIIGLSSGLPLSLPKKVSPSFLDQVLQ